MHSVRIELAKLMLLIVGTRITYQATGDAVSCPLQNDEKWECCAAVYRRGGGQSDLYGRTYGRSVLTRFLPSVRILHSCESRAREQYIRTDNRLRTAVLVQQTAVDYQAVQKVQQ